jgi:hypothetical protein
MMSPRAITTTCQLQTLEGRLLALPNSLSLARALCRQHASVARGLRLLHHLPHHLLAPPLLPKRHQLLLHRQQPRLPQRARQPRQLVLRQLPQPRRLQHLRHLAAVEVLIAATWTLGFPTIGSVAATTSALPLTMALRRPVVRLRILKNAPGRPAHPAEFKTTARMCTCSSLLPPRPVSKHVEIRVNAVHLATIAFRARRPGTSAPWLRSEARSVAVRMT